MRDCAQCACVTFVREIFCFFCRNYWPICCEMIYVNQINLVARHGQNGLKFHTENVIFLLLKWKLTFAPLTEYTSSYAIMPCHALPWFDLSVNFVKINKSVEQIKRFDACSSQTSMLSNWTFSNVIYISVVASPFRALRHGPKTSTAHLASQQQRWKKLEN